MPQQPVPRGKQRLGGAFIATLSAGGTAWTWYTALGQGYFYPKASFLFAAFLVMGVGLFLFPGYREERLARGEDISGLEGAALITPRWWAILVLALLAGAASTAVLW